MYVLVFNRLVFGFRFNLIKIYFLLTRTRGKMGVIQILVINSTFPFPLNVLFY